MLPQNGEIMLPYFIVKVAKQPINTQLDKQKLELNM